MPKLKPHKSAVKRIKTTKSGQLKRRQAMQSHHLTKKSSARKRRLSRPADVAPADQKRIKRLIGK